MAEFADVESLRGEKANTEIFYNTHTHPCLLGDSVRRPHFQTSVVFTKIEFGAGWLFKQNGHM